MNISYIHLFVCAWIVWKGLGFCSLLIMSLSRWSGSSAPLQHVQIVTNTHRMWHKNMNIFWHFTNRCTHIKITITGGILFTHADNGPVRQAFNGICDSVCVCVCLLFGIHKLNKDSHTN